MKLSRERMAAVFGVVCLALSWPVTAALEARNRSAFESGLKSKDDWVGTSVMIDVLFFVLLAVGLTVGGLAMAVLISRKGKRFCED